MLCSVCWLSASTRRERARNCLFLRMSGGIIPLTTGSMKVGVDYIIHSNAVVQSCIESMCVGEQYSAGAKSSAVVDVWST